MIERAIVLAAGFGKRVLPLTNTTPKPLLKINNVTNSLMEAAAQFDFELKIACPKDFMPSKKVIAWAKKKKADIEILHDAKDAVDNADCVMTDKWISMGDKGNLSKKRKA